MENLYEIVNKIDEIEESTDKLGQSIDIQEQKNQIRALDEEMAQADFWDNPQEAQRVISDQNDLKATVDKYDEIMANIEDARIFVDLIEELGDQSIFDELIDLVKKTQAMAEDFKLGTLLSGKYDKENALLSIHAGAGGTEAQDWAGMLLRMYTRYCETKGYSVETMDIQVEDEAGIKSATLLIKGTNAYGYLKAEKGVHRLVRISPFDSSGRRHTSFSSVDVFPDLDEDVSVDIKEEDLRIDTYRSSGAGGQHVNVTDSAVRITHIPTGIVVQCQNERSQIQNRETAMKMLNSRLIALAEEERKEEIADLQGDYSQIAWGSQIRSYVFHPYTMVKDHRTDAEMGNVDKVMDGDLDIFINAYLQDRAES